MREKIRGLEAGEVDMNDLQLKATSERYVRLPLVGSGMWPARYGFGAHVYPEVAGTDTRCERLISRR